MTVKWRLIAWTIYSVGCFSIMLIGFNWEQSIPISIIVGFVCQLLNEIQIQLKKHPDLNPKNKLPDFKFTPPAPKEMHTTNEKDILNYEDYQRADDL